MCQIVTGFAYGPDDVVSADACLAELVRDRDVVERVVEGGPDEGVESRVASDVLLGARVLDVVDPGEEHHGIAHDVPSRLQDELPDVGLLLDHVGDLGSKLLDVHLVLLGLVRDSDSSLS